MKWSRDTNWSLSLSSRRNRSTGRIALSLRNCTSSLSGSHRITASKRNTPLYINISWQNIRDNICEILIEIAANASKRFWFKIWSRVFKVVYQIDRKKPTLLINTDKKTILVRHYPKLDEVFRIAPNMVW